MESTRQSKISRLIQKDLSEIFQREGRNIFGPVLITVTKVHVTSDLSIAKVYVSLFATNNKNEMIQQIKIHSKDLRFKLGQRIGRQVRVIPELQFYLDDSLDYIAKIEKLLDE
jgi:ribosome-binding factor A